MNDSTLSWGRIWQTILLILVMSAITVGGGVGIAAIADKLRQEGNLFPEIMLPIIVVYGVVNLLLALGVVVSILGNFKLTTSNAALGMPEGSIRAVIAIALLLIFVIAALFLASQVRTSVDAETLTRLDKDVALRLLGNGRVDKDVGTQLLTILGTLTAAVAAFYFGAKAVETGAAAARAAVPEAPALRVFPSSPATLAKTQGQTLAILVEARPSGAEVIGNVMQGDEPGGIKLKQPGTFEYTRGPSAGDVVLLRFSLKDRPDIMAALEVRAQDGNGTPGSGPSSPPAEIPPAPPADGPAAAPSEAPPAAQDGNERADLSEHST